MHIKGDKGMLDSIKRLMVIGIGLMVPVALVASGTDEVSGQAAGPQIWALEYGVKDLGRAVDFHTGALGFRVEGRNGSSVKLNTVALSG